MVECLKKGGTFMLYYLSDLLVNLLIAGLGLLIFRLCAMVWRRLYTGRWFFPVLLGIYLTLLYAVTGLPHLQYCRFFPQINLVPFADFGEPRFFMLSALNTLMTVPLGALLPLCFGQYRRFPRTLAAGFLTSLVIELSQMFCFRATDIDDLILNTLGTVLGYFLSKLILGRLWKNAGTCKGAYAVLSFILFFLCFFLRQELYDLAAMLW